MLQFFSGLIIAVFVRLCVADQKLRLLTTEARRGPSLWRLALCSVSFCLMVMLLAMHLQKLTFESHFVFSSKERLSQLPVASLACLLGRAAVSGGRSDCRHGKGCSAPLSPASSLISWGLGAPVRSPCLCRTPLLPQKHSRPSLLLDPSPQAPLRRGRGPSLLLCPLSAAQDKVLVASLPGSQTKGRPQWRHRRFLLILTNYPFTVQLERKSVLIFVFLKRNFIKWDIHL